MAIIFPGMFIFTVIMCFDLISQAAAQETPKHILISIVQGASSPLNHEFFIPKVTTPPISPGTNVTWINNDSTTHTVYTGTFDSGFSGPEPFKSGIIIPGRAVSHTFTNPNTTNDYYCSIHPFMTGKIIVSNK